MYKKEIILNSKSIQMAIYSYEIYIKTIAHSLRGGFLQRKIQKPLI